MTVQLRRAIPVDLPFIARADRASDGNPTADGPSRSELAQLDGFVRDDDKRAWVLEVSDGRPIGLGLCRFRRHGQDVGYRWVVNELDAGLFPPDGHLCEVFQLWVDPSYRRKGLGTWLKLTFEEEARARGVGAIYTHTEASNDAVLRLNAKLGYVEVRRGRIWDDAIRVSLLKSLVSG